MRSWQDNARHLLRELGTPSSGSESPYGVATTAVGHACVGASLAFLTGFPWWAVGVAYWAAKEWRDLRKGGNWHDGAIDAAMVAVGATLMPGWFVAALVLGGLDGIMRGRASGPAP